MRITLLLAVLLTVPMTLKAQTKTSDVWVEQAKPKKRDTGLKTTSIAKLVDRLGPAVVNVIVGYGAPQVRNAMPSADRSAQGSGFIIHPSGYVLTNNHVIEGATKISVRLWDKREYEAKVIGVDPTTDLGLMQIVADGVKFPVIPLGDSDKVNVGDYVVAIGNPLALSHSVTSGIVSALDRRNLAPQGREMYTNFIQTDASINPGNSGGPLISLSGEVIGINTAINRQGQGIGFAIPINVVKTLLPQLKKTGYVVRTWLGIRVQKVTPELAKSFNVPSAQGALVREVVDGGPAAKGGLRPADIIVSVAGNDIASSEMLSWIASTSGTDPIVVEVYRNGKLKKLKMTLEALPNQSRPAIPAVEVADAIPKNGALGLEVASFNGAVGVVVTDIASTSPARDSGLKLRDVITNVDNDPVATVDAFKSEMKKRKPSDVIRFKVLRDGKVTFFAFTR